MRVVAGAAPPDDLPRGAVSTIGNYDGLHRGQRAVLERVVARARELASPAALVTFDPHPLVVLDPARAPRRLSSRRQREALLAATGLDLVWEIPFDAELAELEAEAFVRRYLADGLGLSELWVGRSFAFGAGRRGDLDLLSRLGAELGFRAHGLEERREGERIISSTRIREALEAGDPELAAELLGRPFALDGIVDRGEQLGRRIGWPTANLRRAEPGLLLPADGVYAARLVDGARSLPGVANLGVRPTRGSGGERRVEIHLFDVDEDLYERRVEIQFLRRLRPERRFDGLEALQSQIRRDAAAAREFFGRSDG